MALSPLQTRLRDGIVAMLRDAGVEPKVRQKHTRAEDPDEQGATESPAGVSDGEAGPGPGAGAGAGPGDGAAPDPPAQPETPEASSQDVIIRWELGGLRFCVWLYPDGAGVEEPGDDWWPFDAGDFDDPRQLAEAVLDHVRDILAEAAESGG